MNLLDNYLGKDIRFLAKAVQKLIPASSNTGGGVTSTALNVVSNAVSSLSVTLAAEVVARTSADASLSAAANTASVAAANALSTANAASVVAGNAQSIANVVSVAIANAVLAHTSLVSDIGRISLNLSAVSTR